MGVSQRIKRHIRLSARSRSQRPRQAPPFLVVFINSICNLTCDHCFYWRHLNQRDDLTFEEFENLSLELGELENLNLSGGEPFIRREFAEIVSLFLRNNLVKEVYVPTNGFYTGQTEKALRDVLQEESLRLFACELSLDGMPEYHNQFRGHPRSFETAQNLDQLRPLTEYLYERCPAMDHHNLAIIRGDRKDRSLLTPDLREYEALYRHVAQLWRPREARRYGSSVEPMLQWAKLKTLESDSQYIPCTAGNMTGVIYANGDVGLCEIHEPLGNLREQSFFEIWNSDRADALRNRVRCRECHCTTEVFMWPSIVYQPLQLGKAMMGAARKW
jgi:MoaA/NifB/PqqE/SkfB family radical SAM enzyme